MNRTAEIEIPERLWHKSERVRQHVAFCCKMSPEHITITKSRDGNARYRSRGVDVLTVADASDQILCIRIHGK